jgi:hypothetical protein
MQAGAGVLGPLLVLGWGALPGWDRVAGACEGWEGKRWVSVLPRFGLGISSKSPAFPR